MENELGDYMIFYTMIVLSFIFGIIGYLMGKNRGIPLWGAAAGFFLTIFGIIIIAIVRSKDHYPCPHCRKRISLFAAVCPHCRTVLIKR